MQTYERDQIASSADQDSELRRLREQHLDLKAKLEELNAQAHLSPEQQVEMQKLKKLKLAAKDQIAEILARHE